MYEILENDQTDRKMALVSHLNIQLKHQKLRKFKKNAFLERFVFTNHFTSNQIT